MLRLCLVVAELDAFHRFLRYKHKRWHLLQVTHTQSKDYTQLFSYFNPKGVTDSRRSTQSFLFSQQPVVTHLYCLGATLLVITTIVLLNKSHIWKQSHFFFCCSSSLTFLSADSWLCGFTRQMACWMYDLCRDKPKGKNEMKMNRPHCFYWSAVVCAEIAEVLILVIYNTGRAVLYSFHCLSRHTQHLGSPANDLLNSLSSLVL